MKGRTKCKMMKQVLGFTAAVGGGILLTKLILNKVKTSNEIYSVTVEFDD